LKIATVPVEVGHDGAMKIESFYDSTGAVRTLTAQAVSEYFAEAPTTADDSEQDAFSSAFLSADATLNELRKEMKLGIDGGNLSRANACLSVIASKFSEEAVQNTTKEYFQWIKDAKDNKKTTISWVADGDDMYGNILKNEDIFITKS
jgi:hypothetical protein